MISPSQPRGPTFVEINIQRFLVHACQTYDCTSGMPQTCFLLVFAMATV